jgi:hypothetical protein
VLGARSVRGSLPEATGRDALAARLAVRGMLWALRQESALLLRHWWPAALVGALGSRHVRRAVAGAALIDAVVAVSELRSSRPRPSLATIAVGRRLDDLAYGAGLWWGAIRAHSPRVLLPRRPHGPPAPSNELRSQGSSPRSRAADTCSPERPPR